MHKEGIAKFIGNQNITIVDAMEKIDNNARGILFLQDEDGCLAGCITDGDIRRWLIKTGNLNATVKMAMKLTPKYLYEERNPKHRMCYVNMELRHCLLLIIVEKFLI